MENASKALIIAGAILVSILIIGIGMLVLGSIGGVQDQVGTQADQMELSMFNSGFVQYEGTKVSGTNVKTVLNNVVSSNNANQDVEDRLVAVKFGGSEKTDSKDISALKSSVQSGATYKVELEYNAKGFVNKVIITKN